MLKIVINEDVEKVNNIREALRENDGYCPCSFYKNEDSKCMCKEFREKDTPGLCHCGLYKKIVQ